MQILHLNLAILSSTSLACQNLGFGSEQLQEFHDQVNKDLQNTIKDIHEDTMERLSEWHDVGPQIENRNLESSAAAADLPDSSETHDSFFNHPFSSLNNIMHGLFSNMGAFFGGFGLSHDLVNSEVITTENGTEYNKTLHDITNEEGKVVGKRTTYNFEAGNTDDAENTNSFYQVQSSISFSDIVSVPDSLENEQYYDDGSDSDSDAVVNDMAEDDNSGNVSSENSNSDLEKLFLQNEQSSYRRPNFKDTQKLNIAPENV